MCWLLANDRACWHGPQLFPFSFVHWRRILPAMTQIQYGSDQTWVGAARLGIKDGLFYSESHRYFGPCKHPSFAGHSYCVVLIDDCTRYTWVYTIKNKSDRLRRIWRAQEVLCRYSNYSQQAPTLLLSSRQCRWKFFSRGGEVDDRQRYPIFIVDSAWAVAKWQSRSTDPSVMQYR